MAEAHKLQPCSKLTATLAQKEKTFLQLTVETKRQMKCVRESRTEIPISQLICVCMPDIISGRLTQAVSANHVR